MNGGYSTSDEVGDSRNFRGRKYLLWPVFKYNDLNV